MRGVILNAAILLGVVTILGGGSCATTGGKLEPVNLPAAPACMTTVDRPKLAEGTSRKVALLKTDLALDQANRNIICSKKWYNGVRAGYAKRGKGGDK
jgi:hypothetical protein